MDIFILTIFIGKLRSPSSLDRNISFKVWPEFILPHRPKVNESKRVCVCVCSSFFSSILSLNKEHIPHSNQTHHPHNHIKEIQRLSTWTFSIEFIAYFKTSILVNLVQYIEYRGNNNWIGYVIITNSKYEFIVSSFHRTNDYKNRLDPFWLITIPRKIGFVQWMLMHLNIFNMRKHQYWPTSNIYTYIYVCIYEQYGNIERNVWTHSRTTHICMGKKRPRYVVAIIVHRPIRLLHWIIIRQHKIGKNQRSRSIGHSFHCNDHYYCIRFGNGYKCLFIAQPPL